MPKMHLEDSIASSVPLFKCRRACWRAAKAGSRVSATYQLTLLIAYCSFFSIPQSPDLVEQSNAVLPRLHEGNASARLSAAI